MSLCCRDFVVVDHLELLLSGGTEVPRGGHSLHGVRLASLTAAAALAVVCSAAINFAGGPGIGLDFVPRITIHRRPDASEGEERPVVVERKPHQILVLLGWRV